MLFRRGFPAWVFHQESTPDVKKAFRDHARKALIALTLTGRSEF
jgi:hypothetical protein